MVPKLILDTDVLSEIYKGQNPKITANAQAYLQHYARLSYTSVTASEFLFGLHAKDAKGQLDRAKTFLKANEELVPTSEDYWLMAEISGKLKRRGKPIGEGDPMNAAFVVNRGMVLVSGNTRHYRFVIDAGFPLVLQNWHEP